MTPHYHLYVGVAIAAKTFVATWALDPATAPKAVSFDQSADGFSAFLQPLGATGVMSCSPRSRQVAMLGSSDFCWAATQARLNSLGV